MTKKKKKTQEEIDREVDAEFEAMTKEEALAQFDESQTLHVPAKKRENILISIRLPMSMINGLRDVAIERGDIGYQQVIKIFISDGLARFRYRNFPPYHETLNGKRGWYQASLNNSRDEFFHFPLQPPQPSSGSILLNKPGDSLKLAS